MQLTTPELKGFDAVFPGENWFFYWRSSPSLWEAKLSSYVGANPIFVPINWGLHSEYADQFDFGDHKPETDLKRLVDIAQNIGKKIVFTIPITPAPFLTNGGIPSYVARNFAMDKNGMALGVFDHKNNLNKIYSFFDPRVFQAFRKFVWHMGQFFSQNGISCEIYGLNSMKVEGDELVSFFDDYSEVFKSGVKRYVEQLQDSDPEKIERLFYDQKYEKEIEQEYSQLIQNLYIDACRECLAGVWEGALKVSYLGGSEQSLFKRSASMWESQQDYLEPMLKSVVNGILPSTVLLSPDVKLGIVNKMAKDIINTNFLSEMMEKINYDDDQSLSLKPLVFFELFDVYKSGFIDSGLKYFIDREYPWQYKVKTELIDDYENLDENKAYFFFGANIDQENLNHLLKLFLNGAKVFLDTSSLDQKILQKLELFYAENSIELEKINFTTLVTKASLGLGSIVTYAGANLSNSSPSKKNDFWETVIAYLDFKHVKIQADKDLDFFWKSRSSNTYELNYEEVRRVSLYNSTSYKKKAHIVSSQNFAFIKSVDQVSAELKSTPIGVDLMLMPGGSISLDFGYFV